MPRRRPSPSPDRLLACAVEAARAAGQHALANIRRRRDSIARTAHDVKLELDVECQRIAEAVIRRRFPQHAVLGEEETGTRPDAASPVLWVVDPIDGTVNFSHGLPLWCCSVAAQAGGRTVAGAVFAPALGELYTASRGRAARCNGRAIRVSKTARLSDAMVLTGMDRNEDLRAEPFTMLTTFARRARKARILGSAALDLCLVARGHADGYFENGVYLWDTAAGALIVEQAGGRVEVLRQTPPHRQMVVASNGRVQGEMKRLVRTNLLHPCRVPRQMATESHSSGNGSRIRNSRKPGIATPSVA